MFVINQTAFPPVVSLTFPDIAVGECYRIGAALFRKINTSTAYNITDNAQVSVAISPVIDVTSVNVEVVVTEA